METMKQQNGNSKTLKCNIRSRNLLDGLNSRLDIAGKKMNEWTWRQVNKNYLNWNKKNIV